MPRIFLIDGYNLLKQIPELIQQKSLTLEQRREWLLTRLTAWSAGRRTKLVVVFDGTRFQRPTGNPVGVEVIFTPPPADQYIRQQIVQHEGQRDFIVVSSDEKDIGRFAQVSGVGWMTSPKFWKGLQAAKGKAEDQRDGAPPGWTPQDDEELLKRFEVE